MELFRGRAFGLTNLAGMKTKLTTVLAAAAVFLTAFPPRINAVQTVSALAVSSGGAGESLPAPAFFPVSFPGEGAFTLHPSGKIPENAEKISAEVFIPKDAPSGLQVMMNVVDWDGRWYQNLLPGTLVPGESNAVCVPVFGDAEGWNGLGHHGKWNAIVMKAPREMRVRIFGGGAYTGSFEVVSASAVAGDGRVKPSFGNVRASTTVPEVYGLYELRFDLPDIYSNPFDTREIAVDAEITLPDGTKETQPGFYYQNFFRVLAGGREVIEPQGGPEWRVRYSPRRPGGYSVMLKMKDGRGETAEYGPVAFKATDAGGRGFIRPCGTDPRALEYSDGTPYFPVGFNIRSPYDTRMDSQFPVRLRVREGSLSYARYFRDISAAGGNFAEVWLSAWCFGLEWSGVESGYHGAGWLNLEHAWEIDRLLDLAGKYGININFVLNNHGRLSAFSDREWNQNPYNKECGGWLDDPIDWFNDEAAQRNYEDQLRYLAARYGWSRNIYAWELWSELDLVGPRNGGYHRDQRVVDWHRRVSDFIGRTDLNGHLVSTHTCSNHGTQNPELIKLPSMKSIAVDAYHNSWNPLEISRLAVATAKFAEPYVKPALITEFGGSPQAASLEQLSIELHAALWTSAATQLAGTPMFWWWQVVEEYNLYPVYAAFARYIAGEDRRDPGLEMSESEIRAAADGIPAVKCLMYASSERAFGWIYIDSDKYGRPGAPDEKRIASGLKLVYGKGTDGGLYRIEFWDTYEGKPVSAQDIRISGGTAEAQIPEFKFDIAFKIHRIGE